jgi:excisionase family DNA binding protein
LAIDDQSLYLTVAEAAEIVRMGESTLRKRIKRGEGPPVSRLGKLIRIYRPAFEAWARGDHAVETPTIDDTIDDNRNDKRGVSIRVKEHFADLHDA